MSSRGYQLLPTSLWSPPQRATMSSKKKIGIAFTVLAALLFTTWTFYNPNGSTSKRIASIPVVGEVDETGRRQMDLGPEAEATYNVGFESGVDGSKLFFTRLHDFVQHKIPKTLQPHLLDSLSAHRPPKLQDAIPHEGSDNPDIHKPMTMYRNIFQTDKRPPGDLSNEWAEMNKADGWVLDFYTDERAQEWVDETFADDEGVRSVKWAYDYMKRGVLKADFLRYLLPLVKGGVYSDTDTRPKRRIEEWGKREVEYYNISSTDGDDWMDNLADEPAVIVGVDIDVHERTDYTRYHWEQPLGICQWALSSAPYHPIMQEIARRVVNNTEYVFQKAEESEETDPKAALEVLHWTGPVAFTDSVLSYLLARYDVPWQHLRGHRRPMRIGEVMILPITGFSPGGEKDFGAESEESEQCALVHQFNGSWKGDGA